MNTWLLRGAVVCVAEGTSMADVGHGCETEEAEGGRVHRNESSLADYTNS